MTFNLKKSVSFLVLALCLSLGMTARADEGMWLPLFIERLNYTDMQKAGLRLTAEEIYSINNSSLKDAIIIFGGGCTGEIVSAEGLIFTNHHCGYDAIQKQSSVEHDYLTNGFWAMKKTDELPNDNLSVKFLVRIEDVTQKVLTGIDPNLSEEERTKAIRESGKKLEEEASNNKQYDVTVRSFFNGNEYYMFVYETYKDVRLVGTPPNSIGKFGGDTDNWMWPRHTGDFSVFRVYSSPEGKPAAYNKDNVPKKTKKFLPISIKGIQKNDYAMVMGFPGTTNRFLTSYGVKLAVEETNPTIVDIRTKKLALMKEDMDVSDKVRIQYSSKYAGIANYWKKFQGETKGLKRLKVYDEKKAIEDNFTKWVNADASRKGKYGNALNDISTGYTEMTKYSKVTTYFREALTRGPECIGLSKSYEALYKELKADKPDEVKIKELSGKLKLKVNDFFKDYNEGTDMKLMAALLPMFLANVPAEYHPDFLVDLNKKYDGDFKKFAAEISKKSIFVCPEKLGAFLDNPKAKVLDKDPVFTLMKSIYVKTDLLTPKVAAAQAQIGKGMRSFVAGLREMQPDKKFYPDANGTMRLTYGKVLDYYPADGIHYDYKTTLKGIMEKEDPTNDEFVVPQKLKELYKAKDFGQYAENGDVVTCFLTDNDITGGNSGSPCLNANGELIGLAFDGNWEALSSDIVFEPALQRTIVVDARYVLFVIDKLAGAKNLISELDIRK